MQKKEYIHKIDTEENLQTGLIKAKEILLSTGMVAFPTESFYGLAVDSTNEEAIKRLFSIKERPKGQPILILIPSIETLGLYVATIPEIAQEIIKRFWPGGLTLLFNAAANISTLLTAGTGKIGIRLSSHPIATSLVKAIGVPITGTSANISGQPPCTNAKDVFDSLGRDIDLILDAGETKGGKGSTILDVTVNPPVVLREGMVDREQLRKFITK